MNISKLIEQECETRLIKMVYMYMCREKNCLTLH